MEQRSSFVVPLGYTLGLPWAPFTSEKHKIVEMRIRESFPAQHRKTFLFLFQMLQFHSVFYTFFICEYKMWFHRWNIVTFWWIIFLIRLLYTKFQETPDEAVFLLWTGSFGIHLGIFLENFSHNISASQTLCTRIFCDIRKILFYTEEKQKISVIFFSL